MHNEQHGKDFFFGAMIGSTLGALTALMFTTKKGHKIKHDLMDKYHEFEEVVKHYANGTARDAKTAAKRALGQITQKVAKRAVRKFAKKAAKRAKSQLRKLVNKKRRTSRAKRR